MIPIPLSWLGSWMFYAALSALLGLLGLFCYHKGVVHTEERYAVQAAEGEREQRRIEQKRTRNAGETIDVYLKDKARAVASAASAGAELGRLRTALAQRGEVGSDACAAVRAAGDRERGVLGECAGAVQSLAESADRLQGKLTALQAWVKGVCISEP